ncbi:MAG: GH32 C-terminal domain-containing protein [Clostridia bacterium]|nr:GH32 C-terminal domain-containing protein [Clostridia bacterium]
MLHFRPKQWHIGDVHPFFHDGKTYMYYLIPNGTLRCDACFTNPKHVVCKEGAVAVTEDFIHWEEHPLEHAVLNVLPWEDGFLSCYTSGVVCKSRDLIHWEDDGRYHCQPDQTYFPAGSRDHSIFYDSDHGALRDTATTYYTNEHNGCGKGMDCGVLITTPLKAQPCEQRMLLHFPNPGRTLYTCLEPECSQMLRMGNRWVLLASLARQSIHWVGAPSFWIGQENTPIDQQDWNAIQPVQLDGEDLCAAQVTSRGERWLIFGWIPMNYRDQDWGGDLNLPREIYLLPDGKLGSRLDPDFAQRIQGEMSTETICALPDADFGMVSHAARRQRNFGVHADFAAAESGVQGVLVDGDNGIAAELDRGSRELRIVSRGQGREEFTFSRLMLDDGICGADIHMHVLYDEDIVEVFVNDRYALCARVNVRCRESRCGVFAPQAEQLTGFTVYEFNPEAAVYTPGM